MVSATHSRVDVAYPQIYTQKTAPSTYLYAPSLACIFIPPTLGVPISSSGHGVKYTLQADDISQINMTFIDSIFIIINSVYLLFDIVICLIRVDFFCSRTLNKRNVL